MRLLLLATSFPLLLALAAMSAAQERPPVAARKPRLPITVSKETTFFTGPLKRNGSVDYVAALNRHFSKGVTPQNNAVVPLLRAFGGKEIPKAARAEFYRRLGIKPLPERGAFVPEETIWAGRRTGAARRRAEARWNQEWERASKGPWKQDDCPWIAKWLDANANTLRLIEQASRRSKWYIPIVPDEPPFSLTSMVGTRFAPFMACRSAGFLLSLRAMRHLGAHRVDLAVRDLMAGHRLARLLDRDGFLISSLVAIAVESITAQAAYQTVLSGKLTFRQAADYRKALEKLGPLHGIAESWRIGERCFALDTMISLWRDSIDELVDAGLLPTEVKDRLHGTLADNFDINIVLKSRNAFYDRVAGAAKTRDLAKRSRAKHRLNADVVVLIKRVEKLPENLGKKRLSAAEQKKNSIWLSEALIANDGNIYKTAMTAEDRVNTRYDLTRVTLALAAYRAERGKYPELLPAVVPRYIPALPVDRFSGKPLKYRLTKKAFLLYSIGANGKDDGGKSGGGWDDIAVGG